MWIALGVHGLGLLGVVGYLARRWAAGPWGPGSLAALGGIAVADGLLARALWAGRSEHGRGARRAATVRPALPVGPHRVRSAVRGRGSWPSAGHGLSTLCAG